MNNIAMFDMDSSLFDYENHLKKYLREIASPDDPPINNLWELDKVPYMKARMKLIKSLPGWWRNIPPLEDGFKIFNMAKQIGFDCRILTKGPRTALQAWTEKVQCIQDHLGDEVHISVVTSKAETYGKLLYDDYPDYMLDWLKWRPRGLGIMPVTSSNKDFQHPNVVKWDGTNIEEIRTAMLNCFNRKQQEELILK